MMISFSECPQCSGDLEEGFVNAPSLGVVWTSDPGGKWFPFWSKKMKKLQKDWWGFPKLTKEKMPGLRCRRCRLVIFQYTNDKC
jgi:uncharacterized OB-fold protein